MKLGRGEREERRKSPRQLELRLKGPEWERRADRCGQNTEEEGSGELGLARWGHNTGWSHASLTPTPMPSPCHPASPVSLILVPDASEVWAQPGLGTGETGPCKQFPHRLVRACCNGRSWPLSVGGHPWGGGGMTGSAWEGQGGLCRGNLSAEA